MKTKDGRRIYGVVNVPGAHFPGRAMLTGREGPGQFWAVMLTGEAEGWKCIINKEHIERK